MPWFPHPLQGASLAGMHMCMSRVWGSSGQVEGSKGKVFWALWSLLFVVCSFFPKKKNPETSFCRAAQAAAEMLRGWCGEGGVEKGGRRDQSRSYWEMDSNSCCVYLRRQMDVELDF